MGRHLLSCSGSSKAGWRNGSRVLTSGSRSSFVAPALALLTINKVLMAVMNGVRMMQAFAALQALRSLTIIAVVGALTHLRAEAGLLASAFLAAEVLVLGGSLLCLRSHLSPPTSGVDRSAVLDHFRFGLRGSVGHIALGVNARVDVLILGVFISNKAVGLYTLAATFAEGIYQGFAVVKNIVSPQLVVLFSERRLDEVAALVNKARRLLFLEPWPWSRPLRAH